VADYTEHPDVTDENSEFYEDWESVALSFLQQDMQDQKEGGSQALVKAIYREKGYSMMCCWDNILRVVAGHGLQRYADKRFKDLDRAVMPCSFPPLKSRRRRTGSSW